MAGKSGKSKIQGQRREKENIIVWICSRIRQETVCMSGTGEDM